MTPSAIGECLVLVSAPRFNRRVVGADKSDIPLSQIQRRGCTKARLLAAISGRILGVHGRPPGMYQDCIAWEHLKLSDPKAGYEILSGDEVVCRQAVHTPIAGRIDQN